MDGAAERTPAQNRHHIRAGAGDGSAHGGKAGGEVDDLRFPRGIVDDGRALCQHRRDEQVLGRADGGLGQPDFAALQSARGDGVDDPALERHGRSHGAQAGEVKIDAPEPDRVTAGQGQAHLSATGHDGAEQQHRGAHAPDQGRVDLRALDPVGAEREGEAGAAPGPAHPGAEALQQVGEHRHIEARGHVVQRDEMRGDQGRDHERQHCVLGAADGIGAGEGPAALDQQAAFGARLPPGRGCLQCEFRNGGHAGSPLQLLSACSQGNGFCAGV